MPIAYAPSSSFLTQALAERGNNGSPGISVVELEAHCPPTHQILLRKSSSAPGLPGQSDFPGHQKQRLAEFFRTTLHRALTSLHAAVTGAWLWQPVTRTLTPNAGSGRWIDWTQPTLSRRKADRPWLCPCWSPSPVTQPWGFHTPYLGVPGRPGPTPGHNPAVT